MHPFVWLSLQCGFFNALGAILAQVLLSDKKTGSSFDIKNTITMLTFGSFIFAPWAYKWYPYLSFLFPTTSDHNIILNTILKVGLDQSFGAVTVLCMFNFYVNLINSNGNLSYAINNMTTNLWKTLKVNWYVNTIIFVYNYIYN